MTKSELEPEVRVDSLGRSIKRWVRKSEIRGVRSSIPQPTLTGTSKPAPKTSPLNISRMGSSRGRIIEKLTPGNARRRSSLILSILNTARNANLELLSARGPGKKVSDRFIQRGDSLRLLDAMSTQALGHFDNALKRDKNVNGAKLMGSDDGLFYDRIPLNIFQESAGDRLDFEVLNIEDMYARGAYVSLRERTLEQINRLRKSYDLFDRPDIFNMSERDRDRAVDVMKLMEMFRLRYPEGKFPVRITHCVLEHPGRFDDIFKFLSERIGSGNLTDDHADSLKDYLDFPVTALSEGVL